MKHVVAVCALGSALLAASPTFAQVPPTCADFIAAHMSTTTLTGIDSVVISIIDGMDRELVWQGIATPATLDEAKTKGLAEFRNLFMGHCLLHKDEPLDRAVPWVWRASVLKGEE